MHKLQREKEPKCLVKYKHGRDCWSDTSPSPAERSEIWEKLNLMQGRRCAYCECDLDFDNERHIEHFRQRATHLYPQGTFEWTNLFGSCGKKNSCGNHKDKSGSYNHADLIKPDVDNPEFFFQFHTDGKISIRNGLNENEHHRAAETLRIFNLDPPDGSLRWMRHSAVIGYLQTVEEIVLLADGDKSLIENLLLDEICKTSHLPFSTAIKNTLQFPP